MRRISNKGFVSLCLIVIGIVLIFFAQHYLHQEAVAENQPFFERAREWFVGLGDWFKGLAEPKQTSPVHSPFNMKITFWVGVAITAIGVFMLIFGRKKMN